jgi:2'-5' RNA ligase
MAPRQYALVAYVRDPVGIFVEDLRRELFPERGHLPAHITILPPRPLQAGEEDTIHVVRREIERLQGFEVEMGDVENFFPTTPTIFLRVARGAYRLRELHDALNLGCLFCHEQWTYMPHMTVVKMPEFEQAKLALQRVRERWAQYRGPRNVLVDRLSFVREGDGIHWDDLASVPLGSPLAALPR